jgi:uncharacterized alkaline shock family protein YloU
MFPEEQFIEGGSVRINNEVVAIIAAIAANEVEGIARMGGGFSFSEVFGKKAMNKGVRVEIGQGEAAIDLYVVVEYGKNIPELAAKVQQNVKRQVEAMTGLSVVEVNMIVEGVQYQSEQEASATTPETEASLKPYEYKNYR